MTTVSVAEHTNTATTCASIVTVTATATKALLAQRMIIFPKKANAEIWKR